ncbi:MAG: MFS transporter [Candidatus Xenobia bacterium]
MQYQVEGESGALSARLAAFEFRDFRLLWFGQFFSLLGSRMRAVAVTWHIYHLTGSALSLGAIGLAQLVPMLVFGLSSGLLADRMDRRRLMMVTQSCMMLCSAALAVLTWSGHVTTWWIYALVCLSGVGSTFDLPARQALIPSLVSRGVLQNALNLNMLAWQVASVAGPSVGGLLLARFNVAVVYALDAVSFLAVLVSLVLMQYRREAPPEAPTTAGWHAVLEGLRFVMGNPLISSTMVLDFVSMFFGSAMTMLPVFADRVLHTSAAGFGLLYAAPSIGAVIAAVVLTGHTNMPRQGKRFLAALVVYGLCTMGFGLSTNYLVTVLMLAGTGMADTLSTVIRSTMRQLLTPDELRGRMTSVNMLFFVGGPQLGEMESGIAAHWLGVGPSVAWAGAACILTVLAIAARVPQLRRYDRGID